MQTVWISKQLPLHLKIDIFQATCLPILLYGSEAWVLSADMKNRLNSYATSCYRFILNIKRTDRVRNETVLGLVGRPPLADIVTERQLRRLGHVLRQDEDSTLHRFAIYCPQHGKRKRGRPRLLFHKYMQQVTGLDDPEALKSAAQDRDGWRQLVVGCCSLTQPI